MLVKSFVSNSLSYNLNKYTQYKTEAGCLHQYTVTALYRLDRNEKLLEIFAYPSNSRAFYGPELNL